MAAALDELSAARFGLRDFDAIDTSGRPELEGGENVAGDYPHVTLLLGEDKNAGAGHLYISST